MINYAFLAVTEKPKLDTVDCMCVVLKMLVAASSAPAEFVLTAKIAALKKVRIFEFSITSGLFLKWRFSGYIISLTQIVSFGLNNFTRLENRFRYGPF